MGVKIPNTFLSASRESNLLEVTNPGPFSDFSQILKKYQCSWHKTDLFGWILWLPPCCTMTACVAALRTSAPGNPARARSLAACGVERIQIQVLGWLTESVPTPPPNTQPSPTYTSTPRQAWSGTKSSFRQGTLLRPSFDFSLIQHHCMTAKQMMCVL